MLLLAFLCLSSPRCLPKASAMVGRTSATQPSLPAHCGPRHGNEDIVSPAETHCQIQRERCPNHKIAVATILHYRRITRLEMEERTDWPVNLLMFRVNIASEIVVIRTVVIGKSEISDTQTHNTHTHCPESKHRRSAKGNSGPIHLLWLI